MPKLEEQKRLDAIDARYEKDATYAVNEIVEKGLVRADLVELVCDEYGGSERCAGILNLALEKWDLHDWTGA